MKILAAVILVCSVLCATATFHSKQNEVEPKPDIFGSLIALKKNLFGGLKGGKGESSHGSGSASGGASIGGVDNGYNYPPPAPKPVYGPPIALPAPAPRPVYIPPPSLPPPVPRPVYGPPHAAPISISSSGASAAGETSSGHGSGNGHSSGGGHGNIFKSFSDLPVKAIGAKRQAINKILDKKLALIEMLSGGLGGGKSHAGASSSTLDF